METPSHSRMDLAGMRDEYTDGGLDETELDRAGAGSDPVKLFHRWLDEAVGAQVHEPNAMALATATPEGRPSSRIVLLKGFDADGLVFYTGYASRKGRELEANPYAAATMLWHPMQRQVRVEGAVTRLAPAESDAYFASRPHGSQVSAAASPQSRVVADRAELDRLRDGVERSGPEVVRPATWGGYRIRLDVIEFWQGRQSRFHDRLRYESTDEGWTRTRLAP
ncbi:pyridoxamine 5'-phosphate oxidase [Aeromicrobium sp. CF3.5]|uniref:pyridoxamine 5'-phosphate oxidase n=1 Tax=Aeromicrobium sp. CF3.5 TaxID=3373078 RepID=UPI003EE7E2E3